MTISRTWMGALCVLAALLATPRALAQQAAKDTSATAAQAAALDRASGKLRALTPEEARALVASEPGLQQSDAGLVEVQHADGTVSMDLEERFMEVLLARTAPGGDVDTRCVTSQQEAEDFLTGAPQAKPAPVQPAAPLEEK